MSLDSRTTLDRTLDRTERWTERTMLDRHLRLNGKLHRMLDIKQYAGQDTG